MIKILKNNLLMLKYIFKYCPSQLMLVNVSSLFGTLTSIIGIFFTKYIIDSLMNGIDFITMIKTAIIIFLINIIISLFNIFINQYITPINTLKLSKGMQNELFQKCLNINYSYYENPQFYNDFTMAFQQADNRALSVLSTISSFFSSIVGITSFSIVISLYDPILFVLVLLSVVVNLIFMFINTKKQHEFYESKILNIRKSSYAQRVFYLTNFAKELRLYKGIATVIKSNYNNAISSLIFTTSKYTKILSIRAIVQIILTNSIHFMSTLYLAFKVLIGIIKISDFITLSSSTTQLEIQINTLLQIFPSLYEHSLFIENFNNFINYESKNEIHHSFLKLNDIDNLSINQLYFLYPNAKEYSLENINLHVVKGNRIAFVGQNGSGKTSLIKMITQLYMPQYGEILINDNDINLYDDESIKNNISILFQDYQIFSISIIENILMRPIKDKNKDEKIVNAALKKVGLYDRIMKLSSGIYTNISYEYDENGVNLSGGELQRLAIARIFVRDSNLIILDEPSSSLDPISENEIFNDILNNIKDKIIILITHRLTNIKNCDKIYFFQNGKITEQGNHKELMDMNGEYAKMYNLQIQEILI